MRHAECVNRDITYVETGTCGEDLIVEFSLELAINCFSRKSIALDRNIEFGGNGFEPLRVVSMLVRDENSIEQFRSAFDAGQAQSDLSSAEAGIDQEAHLIRLKIGAIAGGTAS